MSRVYAGRKAARAAEHPAGKENAAAGPGQAQKKKSRKKTAGKQADRIIALQMAREIPAVYHEEVGFGDAEQKELEALTQGPLDDMVRQALVAKYMQSLAAMGKRYGPAGKKGITAGYEASIQEKFSYEYQQAKAAESILTQNARKYWEAPSAAQSEEAYLARHPRMKRDVLEGREAVGWKDGAEKLGLQYDEERLYPALMPGEPDPYNKRRAMARNHRALRRALRKK